MGSPLPNSSNVFTTGGRHNAKFGAFWHFAEW
jgi:hypothetical protein